MRVDHIWKKISYASIDGQGLLYGREKEENEWWTIKKGVRYCKIPYHISGDDEGGDKISLLVSPFLDRRICLIYQGFSRSHRANQETSQGGREFLLMPQLPKSQLSTYRLFSLPKVKKNPNKRRSSWWPWQISWHTHKLMACYVTTNQSSWRDPFLCCLSVMSSLSP